MQVTNNTDRIKIGAIIVACIMIVVIFAVAVSNVLAKSPTPLHKALLTIGENAKNINRMDISHEYEKKYPEGSAENLLICGVCQYYDGNLEEAEKTLTEAVNSDSSDVAVPIFSRYYLNMTQFDMGGIGDIERAREMADLMAEYPPLRGDIHMLWEMLNYASDSYEKDLIILEVLENYMANTGGLKRAEIISLRNYIASMEYYIDESALALRDFYEVLRLIDESANNEFFLDEEIRAKSFIGDINFNYGDYEEAIKYYDELINIPVDDPVENARVKYVAYINRPTAYLEMGNPEMAETSSKEIADITPYLDEEVAQSIETAKLDLLAQIAVLDGDYATAEKYVYDCIAMLDGMQRETFMGMEERINFTRAKIFDAKGDKEEAIKILEDIAENGEGLDVVLGYDLGELLLKLYADTGKTEKYMALSREQMDKRKEDMHYLELSYLDLGKYYQRSDQLMAENTKLHNANYTALVLCVVIILFLALMVFMYLSSSKANLKDQLTGLGNRKKLEQVVKTLDKQQEEAVAMIMLDIDFFKNYNDTYGHIKGDSALQQVANVLKSSVREGDEVIRYGGEEFLIILKIIDFNVAKHVCQRISEGMRVAAIEHKASSVDAYMTLSMGMCFKPKEVSFGGKYMIQKADEALYRAKTTGRNKTEEIIL